MVNNNAAATDGVASRVMETMAGVGRQLTVLGALWNARRGDDGDVDRKTERANLRRQTKNGVGDGGNNDNRRSSAQQNAKLTPIVCQTTRRQY